jgi:restriction endonuclease Mrr
VNRVAKLSTVGRDESDDRGIGPREIREFIGALQDVEASKGMVDAGVGATTLDTFELKRIDEDYFVDAD